MNLLTCSNIIGQKIGKENAVVDSHGFSVMCAHLPFDSWRQRHDLFKLSLETMLYEARIVTEVEVYGRFSHLIPTLANNTDEALHFYREKQGLVPDFLLKMESPSGLKDTLAELKFISAGLTYYNSEDKQVDVRARSLQQEYVRKCRDIDKKYCGASPNTIGPLEQHLRTYGDLMGLVVGQFGEASQGLHDLVDYAAQCKANTWALAGESLSLNMREVQF